MPVLDSDIIIAFFRNIPKAVKIIDNLIEEESYLQTTIFNVAELYKGAFLSSKVNENLKQIEDFLQNINILDFTLADVLIYAQISSELRKKGEKIGIFDELIASIAINNDETLITRNIAHYKRISQLSLKDWDT